LSRLTAWAQGVRGRGRGRACDGGTITAPRITHSSRCATPRAATARAAARLQARCSACRSVRPWEAPGWVTGVGAEKAGLALGWVGGGGGCGGGIFCVGSGEILRCVGTLEAGNWRRFRNEPRTETWPSAPTYRPALAPAVQPEALATQGATTVVPYAANVVVQPVQYNGCSCMTKSCKPTGLTKVVGWSLLCA
jgi:hypothetical protein